MTSAKSTVSANLSGISRRHFLRYVYMGGAVASSTALLGACSAPRILDSEDEPGTTFPKGGPELDIPTGPLAEIGELQSAGFDNIEIPPGFSIRRVATEGQDPVLDANNGNPASGYLWHSAPDGGGVFVADDGSGDYVYASNSEASGGAGGVGALRFNANGDVLNAYAILTGTTRNCAGGVTPWGTWMSCEENGAAGQIHETFPFGTASDAVVKPALGSRNHEAMAIDLDNFTSYTTEDAGSGSFWRFVSDPSDATTVNGKPALKFEDGTLQVMSVQGFEGNGSYTDADLQNATPVKWVDPDSSEVTPFAGGEGIWFYEVPEALRTIPELGTVATKGVVFFATKGDNRVWAYDVENQLVEIIFSNELIEDPALPFLPSDDYNDVDNLVISPSGDCIVAEDGSGMRLMVVIPNEPPKILFQITGSPSSEIVGPAFHPDGSKLYFSAQRGPSNTDTAGVTYELTIPPEFRS